MSQVDVLAEAQDLLLDLGDTEYLQLAFTDTVRRLAMRCPVFTEVRQISTYWAVGQWTETGGTYTDDTTDAQDAGTNDVALASAADNDGHMIGASGMFERVVYVIGTAASGGTYEYTYWASAGLWRTLTLLTTPNFAVTGTQTMAFVAPDDWAQKQPTDVTFPADFDGNLYWVRVRATATPGMPITGQGNIESVSQAMFLTVDPLGANQVHLQQASGLVRLPLTLGTFSLLATTVTPFPAFYPLPDTLLSILTVLYYPNELEPAPVAEGLDLLSPTWRTATATVPTRYTQDLGPLLRLRLTPMPTTVGLQGGLPIWQGAAGSIEAASNNVVLMSIEVPLEPDMPQWYEGLVGYAVAAQEARRLGETQDLPLAQALDGLVDGLVGMILGLFEKEGVEMTVPWVSPLRR